MFCWFVTILLGTESSYYVRYCCGHFLKLHADIILVGWCKCLPLSICLYRYYVWSVTLYQALKVNEVTQSSCLLH